MKYRIAAALLLLALVCVPTRSQQEAYRLFDYISQRIETITVEIASGRMTSPRAAAEVSDLQAIAAAGQVAFTTEVGATGGGNAAAQALAGLQALLGSAAEALAAEASAETQEAFLARLARAGLTAAALSDLLRNGFNSLNPQQVQALQNAAPGTATAVRSADYRAPLAAGSIGSVFVTRPPTTLMAPAFFDAAGRLPSALGGVTVTLGGRLAQLLYASGTQVNFVVPPGVAAGPAQVVVTGNNGAINSGTVQLAPVAPAIYTENAAGTGIGAILNAVTFRRGPFAATTPENPIGDKRTRLAIFLTGIRNAPNSDPANDLRLAAGAVLVNVAESVQVTIGGVSVPVEFAGAHPFWAGLDQVNVVLPAELAGRGTVELAVRAGQESSNTVQVTIQ